MEIENKLIRETDEDCQAVPRAHLKKWSHIYSTNKLIALSRLDRSDVNPDTGPIWFCPGLGFCKRG